jgi:hypothetical protein
MKTTTVHKILAAKEFFQANPTGTIDTGVWTEPTFTKDQFYQWFRKCLNNKLCRGNSTYTDRQRNKLRDARIINDYQRRINHRGLNVLTDPKLKRRYPHIDNNLVTDL